MIDRDIKSSLKLPKALSFLGNDRKRIIFNSAFIIYLLSLLYQFAVLLSTKETYASVRVSEFLINYQGGFVRRGLTGEILFFFANNFDFNVMLAIKIFCLICFVFVCAFFIRSFLKKGYALYILPLCFFLSGGIVSNFCIRKDYMFFCFLIPILWLYKGGLPVMIKLTLINILAAFMILSHEVFAFFTIPILFLMFFSQYRDRGFLKSCLLSLTCLSPCILAFALVVLKHGGSPETSQAIWNSWAALLNIDPSKIGAGVVSIGWTSVYGFLLTFKWIFLKVDQGIASPLVWVITFPLVYYIATNTLLVFRKEAAIFTERDKAVLSSVLIFQLLCMLPVFAMGLDWSRFIFCWIASSFAIFLIVPTNRIDTLFPAVFSNFVKNINSALASVLRPSKTGLAWMMLFIGVCPASFVLDQTIQTTMLYNVLYILSLPIDWAIRCGLSYLGVG